MKRKIMQALWDLRREWVATQIFIQGVCLYATADAPVTRERIAKHARASLAAAEIFCNVSATKAAHPDPWQDL